MLSTGIEVAPARTMLLIVTATFTMLAPLVHISSHPDADFGPKALRTRFGAIFTPGIDLSIRHGASIGMLRDVSFDNVDPHGAVFDTASVSLPANTTLLQFGTMPMMLRSMSMTELSVGEHVLVRPAYGGGATRAISPS